MFFRDIKEVLEILRQFGMLNQSVKWLVHVVEVRDRIRIAIWSESDCYVEYPYIGPAQKQKHAKVTAERYAACYDVAIKSFFTHYTLTGDIDKSGRSESEQRVKNSIANLINNPFPREYERDYIE
jgi:hypothetical protein